MDHRIRSNKCLKCGTVLDGAANVSKSDKPPEVGDVSVCIRCGHVMEFGLGLVLQEMSDKTLLKYAGDRDLVKATRVSELFRQYVTRPGKNKR